MSVRRVEIKVRSWKNTIYLKLEEGKVVAVSDERWRWTLGKNFYSQVAEWLSTKKINWKSFRFRRQKDDAWIIAP